MHMLISCLEYFSRFCRLVVCAEPTAVSLFKQSKQLSEVRYWLYAPIVTDVN